MTAATREERNATPLPPAIGVAVDRIIEYLAHDEFRNFMNNPSAQNHIYIDVALVAKWRGIAIPVPDSIDDGGG